ncbi:thermonuclease family protein [Synechococcus sp. A10-1-5-1]|uniref:thermonuclease family protein n=1 Tax=Synechococcus sp. A10-1-5-1 TaxID=2936507 RepID=UPI002000FF87|nr:thermonuclease family protein [Synechococcus sp. A10-1-5-1]UPM51565.1 thermonuclease family protein [Synechococcus sp. A10-1-5-1]
MFSLACTAGAGAGSVKVLSIGDGDTLAVSLNTKRITVRLACIDAPEAAQAPYGRQAKNYLQQLAPVGVEVLLPGIKKDRYGRTVSEIFRGDTNVNLELVRRGQAFVYRQYLQGCDREAYLTAERHAEASRAGVWSLPGGVTRPWDWRKGRMSRSKETSSLHRTNSKRYRCSAIGNWHRAQELLKHGHTYLDRDDDGEACENLR